MELVRKLDSPEYFKKIIFYKKMFQIKVVRILKNLVFFTKCTLQIIHFLLKTIVRFLHYVLQ